MKTDLMSWQQKNRLHWWVANQPPWGRFATGRNPVKPATFAVNQ